ncbi:MAG: hypothetical protein RLZZ618_78 [Pseudomonadota bacterium]|jgi:hypothetical protein
MLNRIKRWLGPPTMEDLAATLTPMLEQRGMRALRFDAGMGEIRGELNGGMSTVNLGNVYRDYIRVPRSERAAVLARFLNGINATQDLDLPTTYEQARARLVPLVRTRADEGIGLLTTERLRVADAASGTAPDTPADSGQELATTPLVGDLLTCLGLDTPDATLRVNKSQLADWGVNFDTALADALQNLRALPEHVGWVDLGRGLWAGDWGDSYDSSRILLPDLIHRRGLADPVVLVPLRHRLLLCSARDEPALAAMAEHAAQLIEGQPRWLSLTPIQLVGQQWQVFTPPASCSARFNELRLQDLAETYASQKDQLDEIHQSQGIDLFVASATLARADGQLTSYSVWTDGVDTLLPQTDLIVFNPKEDAQASGSLLVPWALAQTIIGPLLQDTGRTPARFRVNGFPDAMQWALLKAQAQEL